MLTEHDVRHRLDSLAKPRQALGRLEDIAVMLALAQQTLCPVVRPRTLVLFAADHGVVASGVSAWPSAVTGMMVETILAGRATSNALARAHGCDLRLVDVACAAPPPAAPPGFYRAARLAPGSADLACHPALTVAGFDDAWTVGASEAASAIAGGARLLIAGEMGIGNTTPAACLTMLLADCPLDAAVGRGAGADDAVLAVKRQVVRGAVDRARALFVTDPAAAIAAVAGHEIVAMAGFFATAAAAGTAVLLDGYVATAAALIANRRHPGTAARLIAAHRSAEPGHGAALAALGLVPMLDWGMRLGEGTGALVALPLLDSAAALLGDVATLAEIGTGRAD